MDQNVRGSLISNTITRRDLTRLLGIAGGGIAMGTTDSALAGDLQQPRLLQVTDGERPEIVIGITGLPTVLDPGQGGASSIVGTRVSYTFFDPMVDYDYLASDPPGFGTDLIPMIATSFGRVDDLTYEIILRDDVLFHDGTPLTAEDVKFTIERIIDPNADAKLAAVAAAYGAFERVDVVDPYTLRLTSKAPDPVVETRLPTIYILPKAYTELAGLDGFALAPVGTGPYKVTEFVPGETIVCEAFDDYFGGTPPFSKVTYRVIPEVATRMAALASDEIQIATSIPPDQVTGLESDDSLAIQSIASSNAHFLFYNTNNPVLAKKEMRQGLNMAIDLQLIVDTLWLGHAELMRNNQVEEWGEMYNPDRTFPVYDPERARELIEGSGYDGAEIVFNAHPTYYTLGADAAQVIVSMWQEVGVNARVNLTDDIHGDKENLMVAHWSIGLAPNDPVATSFLPIWTPSGMIQTYFWTPPTPEFNDNLITLTSTLDAQVRYDAYQAILDTFEEEATCLYFYRVHEIFGSPSDLGWHPYSNFRMDFRQRNIDPAE